MIIGTATVSTSPLPRFPALPTMFLGHYGVAFALKRAEPKLSLGTLFLAAQLLDLLWGIFLLLGWEHARIVAENPPLTQLEFYDYPISHSLIGALAWSMVAAACYYSWPTRDTTRHWQASAIVGLAVFSHYPLDVLVHLPDLPIMGNDSPKLGLGLWNHPVATLVAELLVFGLGLALYVGAPVQAASGPSGALGRAGGRATRRLFREPLLATSAQHDHRRNQRNRPSPAGRNAGRMGGPAYLAGGARGPASHTALKLWTGCSSRSARCPP